MGASRWSAGEWLRSYSGKRRGGRVKGDLNSLILEEESSEERSSRVLGLKDGPKEISGLTPQRG
jgi:hypothetical protein